LKIVTPGSQAGTKGNAPKNLKGTVYLDPGHGGVDTGTTGVTNDGTEVDEKTVVLQIALRLADRLRADGLKVVMTRTSDADPCITPSDLSSDGQSLSPSGVLADLQCRIDKANDSKAQVLLSLHMNAFSDPSVSGTETYYDSARPFASQNQQLAQLVQQGLMNALHAQGYSTPDRGISSDTQIDAEGVGTLPDSYNHLVVLGPAVLGRLVPSQMPGALTEIFFLSNPAEATAVTQPGVQDLVAGALAGAIESFLSGSE
jgi:N-acetylmuramoyl-L-alanine amidase